MTVNRPFVCANKTLRSAPRKEYFAQECNRLNQMESIPVEAGEIEDHMNR